MGVFCFFFFNDTATTEIYTLSLHDALPISAALQLARHVRRRAGTQSGRRAESPAAGTRRPHPARAERDGALLCPRNARPGVPHVLPVRPLQAARRQEGGTGDDRAAARAAGTDPGTPRHGGPCALAASGAVARRGPGHYLRRIRACPLPGALAPAPVGRPASDPRRPFPDGISPPVRA